MEPLEIFALDKDFNRLTGSLPYRSLQWSRRYYEPGQFEVHVPSSIYSPDWVYIYTEDRPETGIIQKREYTDDSEVPGGDDTIRLVGYFTERWLYDYTFLVEDTDVEEEYIYKPSPRTIFVGNEPELYINGVGDIYVMRGNKLWTADGTPTNYSTNGMERLEYEPAKGVTTYMAGGRPMWYQDTRYNYFDDESGEFCRVDSKGNIEKVDAAGVTPITITGNTYGASDGVVFIEDGKWQWATNYYRSVESTYVRQVEKWEERTEGLKKDPGGTVAVMYRTVKGPWNLRTAVEEVGKPRDNCQAIITWAQRMWGNAVCYDEPDFKGVTKVLDPSLQNFGEFTFKELATIGASVRMFYSFVSNVSVFQIWRGRNLTQRANQPKPPEEKAKAAALSVETRAVTGYTLLQSVKSNGNQWFDTGFNPSSNTRVVMHCNNQDGGTWPFFGSRDNPQGNTNSFVCWSINDVVVSDYGTERTPTTTPSVGALFIDKNKNVCTVNGASVTSSVHSFTTKHTMHVLGVNDPDGDERRLRASVTSFTIYENDELKHDYAPAIDNATSTPGMLDMVTGEFHGSEGSGQFIAGSEIAETPAPVLSDEYESVDFIESDGTAFINTGFSTSSDTSIEIECETKSDPASTENVGAFLFGSAPAWNGNGQEMYIYGGDVTFGYGAESVMQRVPAAPLSGSRIKAIVDKNKASVYVNGNLEYVLYGTPKSFMSGSNLTICGLARTGVSYVGTLKIYRVVVRNGNVFVMNAVPARRKSDDAVGMYDMVSGEFFTSSGSGQFTAPESVDPDPDPRPEPSELSPWVVFSDTWGSMHGFVYSVDESNYRNKCYVMYEYDEPMYWDGDGAPLSTEDVVLGSDNSLDTIDNYPGPVAEHIPYVTKRGYKTIRLDDDMRDIECYLDMRSAKPEFDQSWPRDAISAKGSDDGTGEEPEPSWDPSTCAGLKDAYEAWPQTYESAGKQELNDKYPIERDLDTGTLTQDEYLTTWDLGDVVDMAIYAMGVLQEARITGVDESYESGSVTIKPQFGEVELMQTVQEEE